MWRKLLIIALFIGLWAGTASAQEKSYSADKFDVEVAVQGDGALQVTETVTFDFLGGPFTFVFRELETDLTDGIINIQAGIDGRTLPEGDRPGQVEISGNDPIRVEWHMESFSDSRRTFNLDYRILGVVRQTEAADLLIYQPLPDEFEYSIDSSTVTFTFPATAEMSGEPVVTTGNGRVQSSGNQVTITAQNLSPNETMVVEIPFTLGSLISAPPEWQQRQVTQRAAAPWWIGAAVVVLVVGFGLALLFYRRYRPAITAPPSIVFEPPSNLPPALAGAIISNGLQPAWSHALGTLFALADRGVLRIDEIEQQKWFRQHDFAVELLQEPAGLRGHEQGLLAALFETKRGKAERVKLSELNTLMSSRQWKKFAEPLEAELKAAGFFSQTRKQARDRMNAAGLLLIFAGIALLVALAILFSPYALGLGLSITFVGLAILVAGVMLSPLTDEGAAIAAEWQRFADHLRDVTRGKAAVSGPEMFQRFLPYAASFGLLEAWAKWFQEEGWTELPAYFHALSYADDSAVIAFVAMSAATSSSGGSAAGVAGAAGAGAAGGGASGAG